MENNLENLKYEFELKYLSDLSETEMQKFYEFIKVILEEFKIVQNYTEEHFFLWKDYFSLENLKKYSLESEKYFSVLKNLNGDFAGFLNAEFNKNYGRTLFLGVDKSFRRLGLGEKLFDDLKKYCKENGIERIFSDVHPDNIASIKLHNKVGFEFWRYNEGLNLYHISFGDNNIEKFKIFFKEKLSKILKIFEK